MAWPSLFRRKAPADPVPHPAARQAARRRSALADPSATPGDVGLARTRARRRLIGASVLLGIGVIAFPLLFETEPRPIPVDLPIEIPRPDAVPPLALPGGAASAVSSGTVAEPPPAAQSPAARAPAAEAVVTERAVEAPVESAPPAKSEPPAPSVPPVPPARSPDGARAQALLEGKPVTAAKSAPAATPPTGPATATRFVVQVGAFADDGAVRAVRARVERLGLRTYTQVVKADAGDRTRVRIGPFDERDQADDVAARLKREGLQAVVLRL